MSKPTRIIRADREFLSIIDSFAIKNNILKNNKTDYPLVTKLLAIELKNSNFNDTKFIFQKSLNIKKRKNDLFKI